LSDNFMEKRKFPRFNYNKKAGCKFLGVDGVKNDLMSKFAFGIEIVNLSAGGACISCEGSARALVAKAGNLVELKIPIENTNFVVNGRVVWAERTNAGINAGLCFDFPRAQSNRGLQKQLQRLNG